MNMIYRIGGGYRPRRPFGWGSTMGSPAMAHIASGGSYLYNWGRPTGGFGFSPAFHRPMLFGSMGSFSAGFGSFSGFGLPFGLMGGMFASFGFSPFGSFGLFFSGPGAGYAQQSGDSFPEFRGLWGDDGSSIWDSPATERRRRKEDDDAARRADRRAEHQERMEVERGKIDAIREAAAADAAAATPAAGAEDEKPAEGKVDKRLETLKKRIGRMARTGSGSFTVIVSGKRFKFNVGKGTDKLQVSFVDNTDFTDEERTAAKTAAERKIRYYNSVPFRSERQGLTFEKAW